MSTSAVRTAFRTELAAAFPAVAQFDTLGVRVDNASLPDLWLTTDFIPISDMPISIGRPACHRELGTFRCFVVGKTGAGEGAIVSMADLILAHFRSWRDVGKSIYVKSAIPPAPSDFSDGRWLISAVDFSFSHDHYV
jgi:hypothetical protein